MLQDLNTIELSQTNGGDINKKAYAVGHAIGSAIHSTSDFIYGFLGTNLE
jgi:hypothetical protein